MSKTYYINGNTVRELEEAQPIRRERRSREEIERARREKNRRNARIRYLCHRHQLRTSAFIIIQVIGKTLIRSQ